MVLHEHEYGLITLPEQRGSVRPPYRTLAKEGLYFYFATQRRGL